MRNDASPTMGAAECMEAFRANNQQMSPKKFWGNVESGLYWFVHVCPTTKKRTVTIYKTDFVDYMHSKGVEIVLPFEIEKWRKKHENQD